MQAHPLKVCVSLYIKIWHAIIYKLNHKCDHTISMDLLRSRSMLLPPKREEKK